MKVRDFPIRLGSSSIELCPERAAFRPYLSELIVADLELGKAAVFRRAGRATSAGTTHAELDRLDALIHRKGADRLTILGNLFHEDIEPRDTPTVTFHLWLRSRPTLNVSLVHAENDRRSRQVFGALPMSIVAEPHEVDELHYRHDPAVQADAPYIAGQISPSVEWEDGTEKQRLPAFWRRGDSLVLPAFGSHKPLHDVDPGPGDQLMAVTPTGVIGMPNAQVLDL